MNHLKLLAKSWSVAANGYNHLLVPRFAPWTDDVLKAVALELPKSISKPRRCCVPCCGPGQELLPLSELLGSEWSVLGVDLAPGMIDVARHRIANEQRTVDVVVGDCSTSLPGGDDHYDLIVSIFGFQQMSDPLSVLQVWLDALSPDNNGLLVLCFWPSGIEDFDDPPVATARPFSKFREVLQTRLPTDQNNNNNKKSDDDDGISWDDQVLQKAKELGQVVNDQYISHDMEWESVDQFWDAMTKAGPWHAMRLKRGDDFVDELKDDVCAAFGDGPIVHRARARLLILRRQPS